MKKFILIVFMLIIPFNVAHAATAEETGWDFSNGWFDKNPGKFTAAPEIYDNDLSTYFSGPSNGSHTIQLTEPVSGVFGFYFKNGGSAYVRLYNDKNEKVYEKGTVTNIEGYEFAKADNVMKIVISGCCYTAFRIHEFDIFNEMSKPGVTDLEVESVDFNQAKIKWKNNVHSTGARIYLDGVFIQQMDAGIETAVIPNLKPNTTYKVSMSNVYDTQEGIHKEINITTPNIPVPTSKLVTVKDISINGASAVFDFSKLEHKPQKVILIDSKGKEEILTVYSASVTKKFSGLNADTNYNYEFKLDYGNNQISSEAKFNFTTKPSNKEVSDLRAKPTAQSVSLEWKMPAYNELDFARIYRKEEQGLARKVMSFFASNDEYTPIFETNGTTFKDLTVAANTEYTYKVTTVDKSNDETNGVTIKTKTPKMSVIGGGTNVNENGDYVVKWESPIIGKIKVLVGGKEFAIVPAADKKIIIPKDKMTFDLIGLPDVKLIHIDDDGNEGSPTKPGGGGIGGGIGDIVGGGDAADILNADNLLKAAVALLGVIGSFVLLRLAFLVVPKLIRTIRTAFEMNGRKKVEQAGRRMD